MLSLARIAGVPDVGGAASAVPQRVRHRYTHQDRVGRVQPHPGRGEPAHNTVYLVELNYIKKNGTAFACLAGSPFFSDWRDAIVCVCVCVLRKGSIAACCLGSGDTRRAQAWLLLWREKLLEACNVIIVSGGVPLAPLARVQANGITACWLVRCVSFRFFMLVFAVSLTW